MLDLHLNFQISEAQVIEILRSLAVGTCNCTTLTEIRTQLTRLETTLMTQTDAIKALKASNDDLKTVFATASAEQADALANIKADEEGILAKLATMSDLTPENQAILDAVIQDHKDLSAKIQAQADAVKAQADFVPDAPVVVVPPVDPPLEP